MMAMREVPASEQLPASILRRVKSWWRVPSCEGMGHSEAGPKSPRPSPALLG